MQGALDCPLPDRASFLNEACAGDELLRAEATSLIAAHEAAGDFIEEPALVRDANVLLSGDLDEKIGSEIGRYRIEKRLGVGGMGVVYLAQDTGLNRQVALKILPAYFASDDARLRRFQREARAASSLNHPNILTIHEVGESDGVYFIATEFIDGETIRELGAAQTLSFAETMNISEQIASALGAAHAEGIVHRDIKPENIMRRTDGLVKILDFGIAKLMEPETSTLQPSATVTQTEVGLVMGTVNYMSPEQARGLAVDERTDIWSLGVVLYEMLAGRPPFSGATRMDTMVAILDREPASLPASIREQHPLIERVISKCLSKDVTERYQSAGELLAQLKSAREVTLDTNSVAAKETKPWPFQLTRMILVAFLIAAISGSILYWRSVKSRSTASPISNSSASTKLYAQMTEAEQLDFIRDQEQRISAMMGDRPAKLNDDALRAIKLYVDYNVSRGVSNNSEPLQQIYARAPAYVPLIARSFKARKVPVIIGIYLPVIESAYRPCYENPFGSKGLFQFLPQTAKLYGVSRDEMCDVEKMTPAAAHYIADHMAELGDDAESMTLVLLSYNRGATSVRIALRELRDTPDYERNFWTLLAHKDKLDDSFRNESAGYVPNFFAAAIIGENPKTFNLQTPPLSSLAQ